MLYLKSFLLAAVAFTILDLLWLGILARGVYHHYLGHYIRPTADWLAAGLFYFIFLSGLTYFVIQPEQNNTGIQVLFRGAFFGFVAYSTYELTNRAVLINWPWPIVWIDILWGTVLCALTGWFSWYFTQH